MKLYNLVNLLENNKIFIIQEIPISIKFYMRAKLEYSFTKEL